MALSGNSRFAYAPTDLSIQRSRINRSSSYKTSMNVGQLIPFYVDEVLPGDTFDVKTSKVMRLQTLLTPMMDNLYADFYFFFVPNRLCWSHWKEFMGENTDSAWIPEVEYSVPQVTAPASTGWTTGTLADYMGIPINTPNISVNALYFRAYALIVNEWFRDQNLQDPVNVPLTDATVVGNNGSDYVTDLIKGGMPFIANKYHDVFTSALPGPQKGPDVDIDLGGYADVITREFDNVFQPTDNTNLIPLHMVNYMKGVTTPGVLQVSPTVNSQGSYSVSGNREYGAEQPTTYFTPSNLYADLSAISAFSINDLRLAFQIQKFYERQARSGSRYVEVIRSFFGVTSPDYRQQRPEYLGGNRVPININQVIQQSASDDSSPLANTAAMSLTSDTHSDFVKSFTEHGIILGLCCVRYDHTYQQGLNKMFSRKTKFDYYFPVFAHIGEQPILNREIFAQGTSEDTEVFGYQEAWYDYRYRPNIVTGEMRSAAAASLDSWHLGDDYEELPYLSDSWIHEDKTNVDRVLAVTSEVSNQIFMDVYIRNYTTRPMPVYSVPGYIDHF